MEKYSLLCNRDGMNSSTSPADRPRVLQFAAALGFSIVSKTFKDGQYSSRFKDNGGIFFKNENGEVRLKGCTDDEVNLNLTAEQFMDKIYNTYKAQQSK